MSWEIRIADEARDDYQSLDGDVRKQVLACILKVSKAPLPAPNGYGKPLGKRERNNLTGFFKIKYKKIGIRVVYTLVPDRLVMNIIVISQRNDNECYEYAAKLYAKEAVFDVSFDAF